MTDLARLQDPQTFFPMLLDAQQSSQRRSQVITALATMAQGLQDRAIPNVTWEETRFTLGRAIEQAWEVTVSEPFFYAGRWEQRSEAVQAVDNEMRKPTGLHDLKVAIGRFAKLTVGVNVDAEPALVAMRTFLDQHAPLARAAEELKGLAVKRRIKTPEEREAEARYVPPIANAQAAAMLKSALEQVTAKHYTQMVQMFEAHNWSSLNGHLAELAQPEATRRRRSYGSLTTHGCIVTNGPMNDLHLALVIDTPKVLHRAAVYEADLIREKFLHKNMVKLASLIDGKPGVQRIEVVGSDLSLRGLTGTLKVSFRDGSSFQAINSVVRSTSIRGNTFHRFPLTFHKIGLPDGTQVARQSEEWMNTVFLPAGRDGSTLTTEAPAKIRAPARTGR